MEIFDQMRAEELEQKLARAREAYYNSTPVVTDEVYDAWLDELRQLRPDSDALKAVGAAPVSAWPKVAHAIPMGSLDKVQSAEEMADWAGKVARATDTWFVTEKLDGISISVRYENGEFVQAVTRGDGVTGEDITPNVARMQGVPMSLPVPHSLWLRGEIVVLKADHEQFFPGHSNPRNSASGTAKRFDGQGCEHLTVLFYQIPEGLEVTTEREQFERLKALGFKTPKGVEAPSVEHVNGIWQAYQATVRDGLPYEIDGLVVRLNDLSYQMSLGDKHGRPVGAVAYKFAAISRETRALARVDQVGGTGRITPVAEFETVDILGAKINRASLYNQKYIEQIGFDVGAKILVSRANDVIPRVSSVVESTGTVSAPPSVCPECGTATERDGEYIVCPNTAGCPAQLEGRIKQWVRELGILEWGLVLIQKVTGEGLVKSVPDLYRLTEDQLIGLERMGATSARNALAELRKVVPMSLEQCLGALGIPLCATNTMQTVVDAGFDTPEKVLKVTKDQLLAIPGMGPKRAEALYNWVQKQGGILEELQSVGVAIKGRAVGPLTGKSVCFTGKSVRKRAELEQIAKAAGATVKNSVGKGLTFLVMADPNSTSTKAAAARKVGTECISEEDFVGRANG